MLAKNIAVKNSRALILGITFKENCPDIRNTKCIDIYHELKQFGIQVDAYDPWAKANEVENAFQFSLIEDIYKEQYRAIILAVAHKEFLELDYRRLMTDQTVIFDTNSVIRREWADARL